MFRDILPIKHLIVLLQYTEKASPVLFHQAPLTAFLRNLSANPSEYDKLISIDAVESGHTTYQENHYYRFSLFALKGSDELLNILINNLKKLPFSVKSQYRDQRYAFRNNLKLIFIQDGLTCEPISDFEELGNYTEEKLLTAVRELRSNLEQNKSLAIRWVSPVRFLKQKENINNFDKKSNKKLKGEARFCHDQDELTTDLLFSRIHNSFSSLAWEKNNKTYRESCPDLPKITYRHNHCYWIDNSYFSDNGKENPMGGLLGLQKFECDLDLLDLWLKILIMGQYIGVGQRRSFGMGRYLLELPTGENLYRRVFPAQSILSEILEQDNLDIALSHNHQDEYDNDDPDDTRLVNIVDKIQDST